MALGVAASQHARDASLDELAGDPLTDVAGSAYDAEVVGTGALAKRRADAIGDGRRFVPWRPTLQQFRHRPATAGTFRGDQRNVVVVALVLADQVVGESFRGCENFQGIAVIQAQNRGAALRLDA